MRAALLALGLLLRGQARRTAETLLGQTTTLVDAEPVMMEYMI